MNTNAYSSGTTVLAYFNNQSDAENAIVDLHQAGFRGDQIACTCDENDGVAGKSTDQRSFWDKVGDFFTGTDEHEKIAGQRYEASSVRVPERYYERLSSGGTFVSVADTNRRAEAEQVLRRNGGEIETDFAGFESVPGDSAAVEGERRIQLLSEQLRIRKERVSQGDVRLRKEVHTERKNIEGPVTREELVVEHVPTSERGAAGKQIGRDQEIRVPLSEERVTVEKEPVVRDEVRVAKRPVQTMENVSDDVRHEELRVEDERKLGKQPKTKRSA